MRHSEQNQMAVCIIMGLAILIYRYRHRPAGTAFGTATWASDSVVRKAGMLAGQGLVIGRTFAGALLCLPHYCHVLLVGGSGSGKGVGIIIPNLLRCFRGSLICFDTKGDLHDSSSERRRAQGQQIIRLAPFNGGRDALNPLDTIASDSPMLVDFSRAMAEALVERRGSETDPYWNDKAVQVICGLIVLVLLKLRDEDRNLNSVQEIASDAEMMLAASAQLRELGGIPARLGSQMKTLFENGSAKLTKEGASVLSTVCRHLSFLDSELVAQSVARSTFDPADLRKPGTTLFIQIPPGQLEAARGLLRCWLSTLIRVIGETGDERTGEVLCLLDEASALGSLPAIEEALVRGRSAGVRLLLAYQSDSQVQAAFKGKPTLLYDNCTAQLYMGATGYETADRLSKSLGDRTQWVESHGQNASQSWQAGGQGGSGSRGTSLNYSQSGRALMRPDEILTMSDDNIIAFQRGMSPILARRVKWYEDPDFNPAAKRQPKWSLRVWVAIATGVVLLLIAAMGK